MRLRQIALVGEDLAAAKADITEVLGLGEAYADPGVGKYGLENAVWPIGDTFLEVVSPKQPGTTAGRLLEKRAGDGGYMAIFQTDDLAGARARVAAQGVRVVDQIDRPKASFTHLHPKDTGGAIVSIDAMDPPEHWEWGGPNWRDQVRTDVAVGIVGCELQGEDPEDMARRWAGVLGGAPEKAGDGWRLQVDGGELRFVPLRDARGEGLGCFDVAVRDPKAVRARASGRGAVDADGNVVLCGTRVRLVQA
ncbi:MAG: VOC family protein [Pseudomonadota bacterium]